MLPTLVGGLVTLRPPKPDDANDLLRIVSEPAVAEWWPPHDLSDVESDFIESGIGWAIEAGGAASGWLEFDQCTDPMYPSVSLDIFVTTSLHGRGHAREAMRLAIRHFIAQRHHRFTIDPSTRNARAIAAYTGLGFRPVGVLREYEVGEDGRRDDGLLMDLLASEFIDG